MNPEIKNKLIRLFEDWSKEKASSIIQLDPSGSERNYFRIKSANKVALGVYHVDEKENKAFISFSETFTKLNFNTPKIYASRLVDHIYLIEDFGDLNLFSIVLNEGQNLSEDTKLLYKKSLKALFEFQTKAVNHIDFSKCTPRSSLDKQSLIWDLNYFKYYFLKPQKIEFDEQLLENDFQTFSDYLLDADQNYFVYRDFQSRNIIIRDHEPYFIDYQGGRMGPLQYDVASLLFQVKANLSPETRAALLDYYLDLLPEKKDIVAFKKHFYPYVLIRICQVLGAYGFRGLIERKAHFIQSIPYAVSTLKWLLDQLKMDIKIPELSRVLKKVTQLTFNAPKNKKPGLTIHLNSFAYKAGIPIDYSGHGEGFVFDCRSLPNPGRLKEYRHLTGIDEPVRTYLQEYEEAHDFLKHVIQIIEPAILKFQERKFTDLSINFGCTGGQHRSVFMAENINKYLKSSFQLNIELNHTQKENWITTD
ncbi:MAG: phosphotransferase [Bacteroidetes bacterium]|nr:phosphotransferase [Bacteroidota bacterium]